MKVTFWDDGFGIWIIPYLMKDWVQQEPRHIAEKYRTSWSRINNCPAKIRAGEFCSWEIDNLQDFMENDRNSSYLLKELKQHLKDLQGD